MNTEETILESFQEWVKRNGFQKWYSVEPLYIKNAEDYSTDQLVKLWQQEIIFPYWKRWTINKWGYNQQGYVRSSALELLDALFNVGQGVQVSDTTMLNSNSTA